MSEEPDAYTATVVRALVAMRRVLKNPPAWDAPADRQELIRIWVTVLKSQGLSEGDVRSAAGRCLGTRTWFPTPAEFIEEAVGSLENRAESAWQEARKLHRRIDISASLRASDLGGDRTALLALQRVGWDRIWSADNDALPRIADEFRRVYKALDRKGEGIDYYRGTWERAMDEACAAKSEWTGRQIAPPVGTPRYDRRPDWHPEAPALPEPEYRPATPEEMAGIKRMISGIAGAMRMPQGEKA